LFGQRICSYAGEFIPEALEVACEVTMDVNESWIYEKKQGYIDSGEFENVELIEIEIGKASKQKIYDRLTRNLSVTGNVLEK